MKKTIKKLKLVSYICLAVFLLISCTQEKEFINEHNRPKIKFEEKSFKAALNLSLFNDALKKVAKQKGALRSEDVARTALEDQYGFTIVTDAPIRIITDENGTVSYTILIERDVKEELKFENLMIKVEDEETTAAIFKYNMTGKGTISEAGEYFFPNVESSTFTDLNVEGKVFYNSDTGEACITTVQLMCNATWAGEPYDHIPNINCYVYGGSNGNNFSNLYQSSSTVCFGSGGGGTGGGDTGGGGGGTGGSSNNTGGLGGSGGNNEPIDVTPIPCRTGNCIEADVKTPCRELEDFYNISTANTMSNNLITKLNLVKENGFDATVSLSPSGDIIYNFSEAPPEICKPNSIKWPKKNNRIIIDHTHTIAGDSYQIPSIEDVFALYKLTQDFNVVPFNYNTDMFTVAVTVDGFKYAIKISDFDALNDIFYAIPVKQLNKMSDKLNNKMLALGTPNTALPDPMAKEFLSICKNFGIKLYRKSTELADTSWKELKLNPLGVINFSKIN